MHLALLPHDLALLLLVAMPPAAEDDEHKGCCGPWHHLGGAAIAVSAGRARQPANASGWGAIPARCTGSAIGGRVGSAACTPPEASPPDCTLPHSRACRPALPASEVLEGASELRIMLCRPKQTGGERSSSSIVAACGIYMKVRSAAQTDMNK